MMRARSGRELAAMLVMLGRYWRTVLPVSHRELRRWERQADAIPDPVLRRDALRTLHDERELCEGAALLATLADRRWRARTVRLLVAFEVLCDYVDTVAEQPAVDPLANGRRLHGALRAVFEGGGGGYYVDHRHQDDGGYLTALVARCRELLDALPSAGVVTPVARRAAARSAEGQARNHAATLDPSQAEAFAAWCGDLAPDGVAGAEWWELAAAACSSLTLLALLAVAGDAKLTPADAARVEAAYFPWISALSCLLDSLADRDADALSGSHSYVAHYEDAEAAARALGRVTRHALAGARGLPRGRQHGAIVAAMICFYLRGVARDSAAGEAIVAELDCGTAVLKAMVRVREATRRAP